MNSGFFERHSDGDSVIYRLDPRTKLLSTFAFILAVALTPSGHWLAYAAYFLMVAALFLMYHVPVIYVLKRSLVILPFVLVVAIFVPFLKHGGPADITTLWGVRISLSGLSLLPNILARAWLSILSLILLTSTTEINSLLMGLERLHVPRVMVMILSFMYRYIFVLVDEVTNMKHARDGRTFGGHRWRTLQTIGNMAGTLFIRSYERGERIYAAMLARGYDGRIRSLRRLSLGRVDGYFGLAFVAALVLNAVLFY